MGDRLDKTEDDERFNADEEDEVVTGPPRRSIFSFFDLNKFLGELLRLIIYFIIFLFFFFILDDTTTFVSDDAISQLDEKNQFLGEISLVGSEIVLDEMLVNTSDELENHFIKAIVVISYGSPETGVEINRRVNQIYDRIRKVMNTKKINEIKYVDGQELMSLEIKREIQKITGKIDIYHIFFKDFTVY